ncbi:MAG TPA: BON domain-containing protein [Myxococcota bacterium]|nr:BON domain-containing protein [Myxococcota bacterium]
MQAFAHRIFRHARSHAVVSLTLWTLGAVGQGALGGCGGGVRPYRAMAKAAASEESVEAQANDKRLLLEVRKALAETDAAAVVHVSPHAYMDRVFLVGFVESEDQRSRLEAAAKGVEGVREVDGYLPVKSADPESWTAATMRDAELKTELTAALAADMRTAKLRVDTEIVAGHIVLLGVVGSESERDAAIRVAEKIADADHVTSFLLLPDPDYEKRLRLLLRD